MIVVKCDCCGEIVKNEKVKHIVAYDAALPRYETAEKYLDTDLCEACSNALKYVLENFLKTGNNYECEQKNY